MLKAINTDKIIKIVDFVDNDGGTQRFITELYFDYNYIKLIFFFNTESARDDFHRRLYSANKNFMNVEND